MRIIPLLTLLLVGCKHEPSIVGNWTGALQDNSIKAEFDPDNTLKLSLSAGDMGADLAGTYKIDPKYLTLELKTYKLKNVPDSFAPAAKQIAEDFKKRPFKGSYHFNSDDELAITYQGKTDILKRVKDTE